MNRTARHQENFLKKKGIRGLQSDHHPSVSGAQIKKEPALWQAIGPCEGRAHPHLNTRTMTWRLRSAAPFRFLLEIRKGCDLS